nr:erythromycin esterase family protein [Nonomuraea wenchangensis]
MTDDEITRWLAGRAVPLDEPAPFRAALDGVRLAGLGEATHGSAEFFSLRRRLTELLVRELGFTTLAIEASAAAARAVDDHVRTGRGDARQVVAGLGFWTLDTAEMLAVVEWLREHNRTAERPVRFAGVDPQHPGAALRSLREHLGGAADELLDPLDVLARSRWGRDEPLGPEVEAAARRLAEHVDGHGPEEAREAARVVGQAADLSCRPFTHADPELTLGAARDRHMAENTSLLLAEPGAKVVLWAHNGHIGKGAIGGAATMGRHSGRRARRGLLRPGRPLRLRRVPRRPQVPAAPPARVPAVRRAGGPVDDADVPGAVRGDAARGGDAAGRRLRRRPRRGPARRGAAGGRGGMAGGDRALPVVRRGRRPAHRLAGVQTRGAGRGVRRPGLRPHRHRLHPAAVTHR